MDFISLTVIYFGLLFLVISITSYVLCKVFKVRAPLSIGFGIGHFIFMLVFCLRIVYAPNFQEWGEMFIVIIDFPISLAVLNLGIIFENVKCLKFVNPVFLYVIFGSLQYYLIGVLVKIFYAFVRKGRKGDGLS